jgi:heme exporter protein C
MAVLFGLLTLVTGPLWARKAWGTWWVWDARITSSLVGWMIAWAYLILRQYGGPGSEKLAAGLALFGMANVPFIYISVNYWRTIHPSTTVVPKLPFSMGFPLMFCLAAFTLLLVLLMKLRSRVAEQQSRLDALYLSLDEQR